MYTSLVNQKVTECTIPHPTTPIRFRASPQFLESKSLVSKIPTLPTRIPTLKILTDPGNWKNLLLN